MSPNHAKAHGLVKRTCGQHFQFNRIIENSVENLFEIFKKVFNKSI